MAIETTSDLSLVGTSQIVDGSVTSAKIADNSVVAAKIAAGAVGSAALASGAVVAASIAAGAVGTVAISSGSATSGQILQANGSGAASFVTATSGGMTLIATATPSAATSVSFSSIPTTYKHILVRWFGVYMNNTNGYWNVRVNSDTDSNYAWHFTRFNAGGGLAGRSNPSATVFGSTDDLDAVIPKTNNSSTAYDRHGAGSLVIYDYASTSLRRNIQSSSWGDNGGNAVWANFDGYYTSTGTAITSIEFVRRQGSETITGTFY